jgi:PTS system mannose-specific IIA component
LIGLVLVTHGNLAIELVAALEHVVGKQEAIATVCIYPEDDMERRRTDILEAAQRVNAEGTIVLTDMFGGTPSNLAISIMKDKNIEVIAGVNLPMLIELAQVRNFTTLEKAVIEAQNAGKKHINVASQLLAGRRK